MSKFARLGMKSLKRLHVLKLNVKLCSLVASVGGIAAMTRVPCKILQI